MTSDCVGVTNALLPMQLRTMFIVLVSASFAHLMFLTYKSKAF